MENQGALNNWGAWLAALPQVDGNAVQPQQQPQQQQPQPQPQPQQQQPQPQQQQPQPQQQPPQPQPQPLPPNFVPPLPPQGNVSVATLVGLINALNAQQQRPRGGKSKIREPEVYDRKKRGKAADRFLLACELYFTERHYDFPAETNQIRFAISYLTDTAQAWAEPILIDNLGVQANQESYDWDHFKQAFERAFGDPDKEGAAIRELEKLKQGMGPASKYASEFRRIIGDIGWDESTFVHYYRKGLKDDIKDHLLWHPVQTRLDALIDLSIRIDDRLYERRQEKAETQGHRPAPPRPQNPPKPHPAPTPTAQQLNLNTGAHSHPVPIQIDAARRGKITPEEKARRGREGLCYYCGEKGHNASAHNLRPRQAAISYQQQGPQYYTPIIAATQSPVPTGAGRSNNPFITPTPTASTQDFPPSTQ